MRISHTADAVWGFRSTELCTNGIEVADRAKIMGHSIETNQKYYTFEHHDYCELAFEKLTKSHKPGNNEVVTAGYGTNRK